MIALILAASVVTTFDGKPYVEMTVADGGYEIAFHNQRVPMTPQPQRFVVALDGIEVAVAVASIPGDGPDDLIVTPPPGWQCGPCTVTVREGESGAVMLTPVALS